MTEEENMYLQSKINRLIYAYRSWLIDIDFFFG